MGDGLIWGAFTGNNIHQSLPLKIYQVTIVLDKSGKDIIFNLAMMLYHYQQCTQCKQGMAVSTPVW
jgi:hypothetical protein